MPRQTVIDVERCYALCADCKVCNKRRAIFARHLALASSLAKTRLGNVMFTRSISSDSRAGLISTMAQTQPLNSFFFWSSAIELGLGTFWSASMAVSIHNSMDSFALSIASSIPPSAAENHPGRSGTTTPQAV